MYIMPRINPDIERRLTQTPNDVSVSAALLSECESTSSVDPTYDRLHTPTVFVRWPVI